MQLKLDLELPAAARTDARSYDLQPISKDMFADARNFELPNVKEVCGMRSYTCKGCLVLIPAAVAQPIAHSIRMHSLVTAGLV
jgi:hypothetical protein